MRKIYLPCLSRVKNYHQLAVTCRASSEHPEMPQVVLLLKMPCDSTSWTGTQVAKIHDPLCSPSHEQDPRRRNALMSRVLTAAPLMLNERSNILTSTEKPITSTADSPDRGPRRTQASWPRVPCDIGPPPAIWNHSHIEDSCSFQWRNVDAVTSEFPLDLHNTSPEYFCHHLHSSF